MLAMAGTLREDDVFKKRGMQLVIASKFIFCSLTLVKVVACPKPRLHRAVSSEGPIVSAHLS